MPKAKSRTARKVPSPNSVRKSTGKSGRRRGTPSSRAAKAKPQDAPAEPRPGSKQALLIDRLRRPGGATIADLAEATGWQAHSLRGAISGTLKKKLGLAVSSKKVEGRGRVYRITAQR